MAGIGMGAVPVSPGRILHVLRVGPGILSGVPDSAPDSLGQTIIWQLRLPRVLLAGLTGGCLGIAGSLFQALFRNPLADPYLIGASSGASLGAVLAIALSLELHLFGLGTVPLLAFLGSTGAVLLVYHLARERGYVSVLALVLAGVAVSYFLSALVSLLTYLTADERLHQIAFWLMGGFGTATWTGVRIALPYFVVGMLVALACARDLNSLLLGEETAHHLGVEVERTKRVVLATASLLTEVAVASGGVIGFVGLVIPHLVRMAGGPDHRFLIPAAALGGACTLMLADAVARTVLAPAELPVGLVTAMAGAPFFVYVLRQRRRLRFFSQTT
ncbi:MAG TPA: iron ABC transporter permease [Firmicutes bacterium]|nr:iron ABC transporter permease [Bacillota bacterium]